MKRHLVTLLLLASVTATQAQDQRPHPSQASFDYFQYRLKTTEPTHHLAKIKTMVKGIKPNQDDVRALPDAQYNKLTFSEKFTYTMIHGEDSNQNCDGPMITDQDRLRIFGHLEDSFGEEGRWSKRQSEFLKSNHYKVVDLLRQTIKAHHRVGINVKNAIVETEGWELTPDLIAKFREQPKDTDILVTLMLLMKEEEYKPFMQTPQYTKLFGDESSTYKSFIDSTRENRTKVVQWALAFYKKMKKD